MLLLSDVRDLVASFNVVENSNVYSGKLDAKKEKSIGVYHRKDNMKPIIAMGGYEYSSYDKKPVSILIHYNRSQRDTEKIAAEVFEKLKRVDNIEINSKKIYFIEMLMNEASSVDTDEKGIYEYVIWCNVIYER